MMSRASSTGFGAPDLATRSMARPTCSVVQMEFGNALWSGPQSGRVSA